MFIQNHHVLALLGQRQTALHANRAASALQKLSSGNRLNRFSDNMVDFDRAQGMQFRMASLAKQVRAEELHAMEFRTFEGAMIEMESMSQHMVQLTVQAADGAVSDSDRARMQQEIDAMAEEIARIIDSTSVGGSSLKNVLDKADHLEQMVARQRTETPANAVTEQVVAEGDAQAETMDAGEEGEVSANDAAHSGAKDETPGTERISFSSGDIISLAKSIQVNTPQAALSSINAAKQLAEKVSLARVAVGNAAKMAEKLGRSIEDTLDVLTEACGQLADTDVAKEMAEFTEATALQQTSMLMVAHMLHEPQQVLALLQSMPV